MRSEKSIITDMKRVDNKTVLGDGFKVFVSNVHAARYEDNKAVLEVEIEGGTKDGKVHWIVFVNTLNVVQILDATSTQVSREEALKRISRALTVFDMPHRMV